MDSCSDLPFDTLVQYSFRSPGGMRKGGKFDATGLEIRDILRMFGELILKFDLQGIRKCYAFRL
jgi:hypothetical protein